MGCPGALTPDHTEQDRFLKNDDERHRPNLLTDTEATRYCIGIETVRRDGAMYEFMVLGELAASSWAARTARSALPDAPVQPYVQPRRRLRRLGHRSTSGRAGPT
jgi:hypothetical protein